MSHSRIPGPDGIVKITYTADPNNHRLQEPHNTPGPAGFNDIGDVTRVLTLEQFMEKFCPKGKLKLYQSDVLPGFSFGMYENGLILIHPGDWISKYSAVLEGNLLQGWDNFARWEKSVGAVVPLANPHLIHAGEHLFYIPAFSQSVGRIPERLRQKKLKKGIEQEVKQLRNKVIKDLAKKFKLTPKEHQKAQDVLEVAGWAGDGLRFAGVIAAMAGKGALATIATSAGGLLIIPAAIAGCFKAANQWEFGFEVVGFEASAYAITMFGYGLLELPPSASLIPTPDFNAKYEAHWGGPSERTQREAKKAEKAWQRGALDGLISMKQQVESLTDRCMQTRDAERLLKHTGLHRGQYEQLNLQQRQSQLREDLLVFYTNVARELIKLEGKNNPRASLQAMFDQLTWNMRNAKKLGIWSKNAPSILKILDYDRDRLVWPVPSKWPT